jgi:hypothetical protein
MEPFNTLCHLIGTSSLDLVIFRHREEALRLVMELPIPVGRVTTLDFGQTLVYI